MPPNRESENGPALNWQPRTNSGDTFEATSSGWVLVEQQIIMADSSNPEHQSLQGISPGASATVVPQFVGPVPETLKCEVCGEVLTDAKQTNCGHRVCGACVDIRFDSGQTRVDCPMVNTEHEYEDCERDGWIKDKIFPDNCARKQVRKLHVYCSNKLFGCQETPTFAELSAHPSVCAFKPIACAYKSKGCPVLIAPQKREEHERECKYHTMLCSDCGTKLEVGKKNEHAAVCPKRRITCSDCKLTYPLHTKQRHKDQGCVRRIGACIYGCSFTGQTIAMMEKHYDDASAMKQHLQHLYQYNSDTKIKLEEAYEEISKLKNNIKDLETMCQCNKQDVRCLQVVTAGNCDQLEVLREAQQQLKNKFITKDSFTDDKVNTQRKLQSLSNRINALELSRGSGSLGLSELNILAQSHDRHLMRLDVRLAEFSQRFQALDSSNYDGILVWKIRDYRRRKQDAVQGRTPSIYSQPFYTSRFGYKMCARIDLNGNGIGIGHQVSLFLVVMKGEYDALLTWPFKQKVTLTLLDQTSAKKHLVQTLRPDPNSSSFPRPTTDMNIPIGCPNMVSHEALENNSAYLKEDTIFIRIKVNLNGLERSM